MPDAKSSATFCTSAVSSSCEIFTLMPVRSVNGLRLAAIADVGAVFSEMKFSVVPANRFHSSVDAGVAALPPEPPHAASAPGSVRAAAPAPARASTWRRVSVTASALQHQVLALGREDRDLVRVEHQLRL